MDEEREAHGRFNDPADLQTGDSITYGRHLFSRRELDGELDVRQRRFDRDYGVLLYRSREVQGCDRDLVAICGLGPLGTLGMSAAGFDPSRDSVSSV